MSDPRMCMFFGKGTRGSYVSNRYNKANNKYYTLNNIILLNKITLFNIKYYIKY